MTIRETLTNILRLPSDARAVVEMARENAEKQRETYALETVLLRKVESLERQLDDARNEVGPQLALIEELRRQLRVGTERIRELETQAERRRNAPKPTTADLWRLIDDELWRSMPGDTDVLVRGGSGCRLIATTRVSAREDRTHYIVLESPR